MDPYRSDSRQRYAGRDYDHPRRGRDGDDDDDFHFRGASRRHDGHARSYESRDTPRRGYDDRGYRDHSRDQNYYSRDTERSRGRDWSERDHVLREPTPPPARPTGAEDVASGSDPRSPILLIRRLKPSSNRQVLLKGLNKKLCRDTAESEDDSPLGANPGSLRGIYFICDRHTDQSLGFAFAEFHSAADAHAALRKSEVLGDQCTVASQRFLVDYADLNAFPIADSAESSAFVLQFRDDAVTRIYRVYRDHQCYAAFEPVDLEPPEGYQLPTIEDTMATQKLDSEAPLATSTQKQQQGTISRKRTKEGLAADEPKLKKPKAADSTQSQLPGQFATWSRKQAELRVGGDAEENEAMPDAPAVSVENLQSFVCAVTEQPAPESDKSDEAAPPPPSDNPTPATLGLCFLCETRVAVDKIPEHVARSRHHRRHLQDTARLDRAYALMKRLHLDPAATVKVQITTAAEDKDYVDRAKMRREKERAERRALKAKAKAGPKLKMALGGGGGGGEDDEGEEGPTGLGASMLRKHGWSDGQGLGSGAGTGRTGIIAQNMYAAGVGLGHERSRQGDAIEEANRLTKGDANWFADKTKSSARQRFLDLGGT